MAGNITFTMIKPCAVKNGHIGDILSMINHAGFKIVAMQMTKLTEEKASQFYEVHKGKPFFKGFVAFMSSGPIVAIILQKENAVEDYRKLIGATDPANAAPGTVRKLYGLSMQENSVHGSDSDETAQWESAFFFGEIDRFFY